MSNEESKEESNGNSGGEKVKKRPLDKNERAMTLKNLQRAKADLEYLKINEEFAEIDIERGIDIKARKLKEDTMNNLNRMKQAIKECEFVIETAEKQLKFGVEVKEGEKNGNTN